MHEPTTSPTTQTPTYSQNPYKNPSPQVMGFGAYGKIPHLPGSRVGPSDRHLPAKQAELCLSRSRDSHELVIVQEKLDGSCVAAWRHGQEVIALGRDGRLAATSAFIGRQQWAAFVARNQTRFLSVLRDGERLVGEWLGVAHGTRYALTHEPFVAFDVMDSMQSRLCWAKFCERMRAGDFTPPALLHEGGPLDIASALARLGTYGHHNATDPAEGVVWRVERKGRVDLLAKFVCAHKVDGCLLPENTGQPHIFNAPLLPQEHTP